MNNSAKTEMAHISYDKASETKKMQTIAMLRFSRGVQIAPNRHLVVICAFDNATAAQWLEKTLREVYGHDPVTVTVKQDTGNGVVDRYVVRVLRTGGKLALQTGLYDRRSNSFVKGLPTIDVSKTRNYDQLKALWRGAFLASGHLDEPGENSRLTINCPSAETAETLREAADRLGVKRDKTQIVERVTAKGMNYVFVISEADTIERALKLLGALQTANEWSGKRTDGEKRAPANRLANFDDANMRRSVKAAEEASGKIERAFAILGDDIPPKLREAGQLRLDNRESSLEQLGQMADPPLSKDAIAGRIRRLLQLADRKARQDAADAAAGIEAADEAQVASATTVVAATEDEVKAETVAVAVMAAPGPAQPGVGAAAE